MGARTKACVGRQSAGIRHGRQRRSGGRGSRRCRREDHHPCIAGFAEVFFTFSDLAGNVLGVYQQPALEEQPALLPNALSARVELQR